MSKTKIKSLAKKIIQARNDYYNEEPTITDAEFDSLIDELTALDPDHPAVTSIGAPAVSEWPKHTHEVAANSLNKAQTVDEFDEWVDEIDCDDFLVTHKLDGISILTDWENGQLIRAVTRGNGSEGEVITQNVIRMKGIPKQLIESFSGNIRGEIVLLRSDHKKYFPEYKNPRNAASGIAKRLDSKGSENLTVIFYTVSAGKTFEKEMDQFVFIKNLGLQIPDLVQVNSRLVALKRYEEHIKSERDALDYDIDGLVIRINDIRKQVELGERNHRPKGQIALKFPTDTAETVVKRFVVQVGKTGHLTPVVEVEPVWLMGATCERASLHNFDIINQFGIDVGATVKLIRANDIIPQILEVVKSTGTIFQPPKHCPECNSETEFNGKFLICPNTLECPAQKLGKLLIWVNEQNILDWSEATIQKLMDAGLVEDVADLYKLKAEQIEKLERMGPTIANKLVKILDGHRELTLHNLIGGLGIKGVATTTTKLVVDAGYDTLEKLYSISTDELEQIQGFGEVRARDFHSGLKKNKKRIQDILNAGVKIKEKKIMSNSGSLSGKSFCFTGKSSLPRKQLQKLVEDAGGESKDSVGKGLTYLVMAEADSTSSKAQKAKKFGTQCISEAEFMEMVK